MANDASDCPTQAPGMTRTVNNHPAALHLAFRIAVTPINDSIISCQAKSTECICAVKLADRRKPV